MDLFDHPPLPSGWGVLLAMLLLLQGGVILLLQRSRRRQKHSRQRLRSLRENLRQQLADQNRALKNSNTLLSEALAQHEASERKLRATKHSLRALFNGMPSMVIGIGEDGRVSHWNRAAAEGTGIQEAEALNRPLLLAYPEFPLSAQELNSALQRRETLELPRRQVVQKGRKRFFTLTVVPLEGGGAVIRVDDVTQGVQSEHLAIQSEKSQALAELATGLANELNAPLSALLQGAQVVARRLDPALPATASAATDLGIEPELLGHFFERRQLPHLVSNLCSAGERAALIVANLLEYSRASGETSVLVDLAQLLRHTLDLHAHSMVVRSDQGNRPIQLLRELASVPAVYCHPNELQQVVVTLLSNAREALANTPANRAPTISMRLYQQDNWAVLEIGDNGPGIPEKLRPNIFQPFFTTKEPGQGTGLGLSAAFFIIRDHHGGEMTVDSTEGEGSRFSIRLPLAAR